MSDRVYIITRKNPNPRMTSNPNREFEIYEVNING